METCRLGGLGSLIPGDQAKANPNQRCGSCGCVHAESLGRAYLKFLKFWKMDWKVQKTELDANAIG